MLQLVIKRVKLIEDEFYLLSYHEQEGRRGSDKLVPGTSVFTSSETDISGNFWGHIKGAWQPTLVFLSGESPGTEEPGV